MKAISTTFSLACARILMDRVETKLPQTQEFQLSTKLRYIGNIFFILTNSPDNLVLFMTKFDNYHPNIESTYALNKASIIFPVLNVNLSGKKLTIDLHTKSTVKH